MLSNSMNIALDYDDTYTKDPEFWDLVISAAKYQGHKVYCVTMRSDSQREEVMRDLGSKVEDIFFTNREAKEKYMFKKGIYINVWIDDMPYFIMNSGVPQESPKGSLF